MDGQNHRAFRDASPRQVLSGLLEHRPGRRLCGGPGGAKARMWLWQPAKPSGDGWGMVVNVVNGGEWRLLMVNTG